MNRLLPLAALVAATIAVPPRRAGRHPRAVLRHPRHDAAHRRARRDEPDHRRGPPGSVVITDNAGPLKLKRAAGCVRLDSNSARCFLTKQVWLDLGDGNDVATIASRRAVWINGGAGDDRYIAIGTDAPSRVEFSGGFGVDVASYFFATEGVRVGVDGMPFDGRPGDNDRIDRTVETVFGSQFDDVLTGAAARPAAVRLRRRRRDRRRQGLRRARRRPRPRPHRRPRRRARHHRLRRRACSTVLTADPVESSILGCP